MLRGITHRQFEEWKAYAELERFDEERADLRAASIVQAIYNVHRGKNQRPVKLDDCVVHFGAKPRTKAQARADACAQVRGTMDVLMQMQNAAKPPRKKAKG